MLQKQLLVLKIMGDSGDDHKEYDPNDQKSVDKIVKYIIDKLQMGYVLYGKIKESKDLPLVASQYDVADTAKIEALVKKLDVFLMTKEVTKRVLAAPRVAG